MSVNISGENKIKIVHVVYSFEVGGVESLLVDLLNRIDSKVFEVHLVVLTNDSVRMVELLRGVKVHVLNFKGDDLKGVLFFSRLILTLSRLFFKINPNIVHNHLSSFNLLLVTSSMVLSGVKAVHIRTIHTSGGFYSDDRSYKDGFRLFLDRLAMRLYNPYVISISNAVHENSVRYFKGLMKGIRLIYNGIDLDRFDKTVCVKDKERYGFAVDSLVITYVSRMEDGKNHDFLIDIFSEILRMYPKAILCFAGDGALKEYLMNKVAVANLSDSIIFLGSVSKVEHLLSSSDLAVFPSVFEGFSIVMIEKLAMGLPVVASDIEPFREIATDGHNAFLVSLDDRQRFLNSIILLLKKPELRDRIGRNARIAAEFFSIEKVVKEYEVYYIECCSS